MLATACGMACGAEPTGFPGPLDPQAALGSLQARPGFQVELMAAEPFTRDPIAFAWGPDGKFWIVEMGDYPSGVDAQGKHGGVVRYLEDTNGDGRYDRSTAFLDELGFPTGVAPWRKGVLIAAAPNIFYAEDTNDDGRADMREVLYTGFGEGNQQHRVNGLKWGLDGWLYCANGDSGGSVKALKTGETFDIRGRDFRIRPDEGLLDPQTGQSQYGRNRDDWDNWFGSSNSKPMYHFALADHYLRRNPQVAAPDSRINVSNVPGAAPIFPRSRTLARFNDLNAANRFTSANSAMVYRDDLFGPEFSASTFVSEPVHNLVHREVLRADGLTFKSQRADDEQTSEFLASTDNWFRPTMLQTGPDGALWVADMYRLVIEHPQWIPQEWQQRLDLRAGHDKGRIYRVFPVGKTPRPLPRLDRLSIAELVAALDSPSGWQRDMVQQLLMWRKDLGAAPLLEKLATSAARPEVRVQALATLAVLGAVRAPLLLTAIMDGHPGVRRHAVRLSEPYFDGSAELAIGVAKLADDADPQVRLQCAYSLGAWHDPRSGRVLGRLLLAHRGDPLFIAAALSSVDKNTSSETLSTVLAEESTPPPAAIVEQLVGMAAAWDQRPALARALTSITAQQNGKLADWQLSALAAMLDTLDRKKLTVEVVADARLGDVFQFARQQAANEAASEAQRIASVRLLGRDPRNREDDLKLLGALLEPRVSGAVQVAAVDSLRRIAPESLAEALISGWRGHGPALRAQILDVLLSREAWTEALLAKIEARAVAAADIDATRRQRLLQLQNATLRERAKKSLAGSINVDRQKVIDERIGVLTLPGDATLGQALFNKRCAVCHQLGGVGHPVGPDLSALTDNSPQFLLTAMLDPNRAVEAKFLDYIAVNDSGQSFTGMLANETGNSITLLAQEGKQKTILRNELELLQSTGKSLMPEGLEKDLAPQDLANVITFLRTIGPRRTFPHNKPQLIVAESDGTLRLAAIHAEIFGSTLVLEKLYKNLGYWSSLNDRALWTIEVSQPGRYAVQLHYACAKSTAGNTYALDAGGQTLLGKVTSTDSWDNYREALCGEIDLAAGRQQITLRVASPLKGALLDLERIELRPVR